MPNLYKILGKAYDYSRNHNFLWFFGVFLSGAGIFSVVRLYDIDPQDFGFLVHRLRSLSHHHHFYFTFSVAAFILGFVILYSLGVMARASLLGAAVRLDRKEPIKFGLLLKRSQKHFWRLLILNLLNNLILALVLLWFAAPVWFIYNQGYDIRAAALGLLAACIFLPLFLIFSLLTMFAMCFVVAFDLNLEYAVRSAFDLFYRLWAESVGFMLMLFVIYALVFFVSTSLLSFIGVLAYVAIFLLKSVSAPLYFAALSVYGSLVGIILFAINGALNVYTNIAWMLFFLELVKAKKIPEAAAEIGEAAVAKPVSPT